jgi:hypothetical protein
MRSLYDVVSLWSEAVEDNRTPLDVFRHLKSEVSELQDEVIREALSEPAGDDGIFGEAIDVIACALDLIYLMRKDEPLGVVEQDIKDYLSKKCQKWYEGWKNEFDKTA